MSSELQQLSNVDNISYNLVLQKLENKLKTKESDDE